MKFINNYFYNILKIVFTIWYLFIISQTIAQDAINLTSNCRFNGVLKKINKTSETESSGTSGTGANIDVLYHKIYWRINPDSTDRKSTRLNSSHVSQSRMPSSA